MSTSNQHPKSHHHNLKSYSGDDIIKDLTEEDILYSVGSVYGIGDGRDNTDDAKETDSGDLKDHISCIMEVVSNA